MHFVFLLGVLSLSFLNIFTCHTPNSNYGTAQFTIASAPAAAASATPEKKSSHGTQYLTANKTKEQTTPQTTTKTSTPKPTPKTTDAYQGDIKGRYSFLVEYPDRPVPPPFITVSNQDNPTEVKNTRNLNKEIWLNSDQLLVDGRSDYDSSDDDDNLYTHESVSDLNFSSLPNSNSSLSEFASSNDVSSKKDTLEEKKMEMFDQVENIWQNYVTDTSRLMAELRKEIKTNKAEQKPFGKRKTNEVSAHILAEELTLKQFSELTVRELEDLQKELFRIKHYDPDHYKSLDQTAHRTLEYILISKLGKKPQNCF